MEEQQLQKIYEAMTSDSGVVVKFTSDSQLTPLKAVLMDVFNKGNKGITEVNNGIKRELSKKAKEDAKALLGVKKAVEKVESAVESSNGGMLGFLKTGNFWMKAGQMMLGAASMLIDYGKQYYGNLKKLHDAGVRISEGFDKAFGVYAGMAQMSHENFAKLLIDNKRFIARMNNSYNHIDSGAEIIAKMAKNLNGKYGMDESQATTVIEFFTSLTSSMSRRDLSRDYLEKQSEILGKHFKGLAAAVGLSIEQFKEKAKMDEQDIAERQILNDETKRDRYLFNKMTQGRDMALYYETGIPTEKVLQNFAVPQQAKFISEMMQATQNTDASDDQQLGNLIQQYNDNLHTYIDPMKEDVKKIPVGLLQLGNQFFNGIYGLHTIVEADRDSYFQKLKKDDPEMQVLDGINLLNRTVEAIRDLLIYKVVGKNAKLVGQVMSAAGKGSDAMFKAILGDDYNELIAAKWGQDYSKNKRAREYVEEDSWYVDAFNKGKKEKKMGKLLQRSKDAYLQMKNAGLKTSEINENLKAMSLLEVNEDENGKFTSFKNNLVKDNGYILPALAYTGGVAVGGVTGTLAGGTAGSVAGPWGTASGATAGAIGGTIVGVKGAGLYLDSRMDSKTAEIHSKYNDFITTVEKEIVELQTNIKNEKDKIKNQPQTVTVEKEVKDSVKIIADGVTNMDQEYKKANDTVNSIMFNKSRESWYGAPFAIPAY